MSNPNYSSVDDDISDNNINDRYPYSEPVDVIVKDHPKLASDDYQALPALETADIPCQYEAATTTMYQNSLDGSYTLPDDEQVYEDPGHLEKNIYAWFEEKKFRMIRKNNIRYI